VFRLVREERREGKKVIAAKHDLLATPGSVIVIPWETNLSWKHGVPKLAKYRGRRISVTLRAFQ